MSLILYPITYYRRIARFIFNLYDRSSLDLPTIDKEELVLLLYNANAYAYNKLHASHFSPDIENLFNDLESVELISTDFAATALHSYLINFENVQMDEKIEQVIKLVTELLFLLETKK